MTVGVIMPRKTFTFEGKRYEVTAKTEAELYKKLALKKIELQEGKIKESNILVKEYVSKWYEVYKKPYVKAKTQAMYTTTTRIIKRYVGDIQLKFITPMEIQAMIKAEMDLGRSKSHIDKLILTVKQVFKQAVKDKKLRENPAEDIIVPKLTQGKRRAITDLERYHILKVAETHRHGKWIRGMLYLGFRPNETPRIQGKDIDLENKTIHIRGTKTFKADRYVPIPEAIINDLRGVSDEEYVYPTKDGTPPNKQRRLAWWHAFKRDVDISMGATVYRNKVVDSVVAEDLTPYCLRHTYGTDAQAAGIPIDVLADLMGHESIETTRKYYIHENKASREAARKAFEKFYQNM